VSHAARTIALRHCLFENGRKIEPHAAVIMPNHVHLLFTALEGDAGEPFSLAEIMKGIKGASARRINQLLGRKGSLWQDDPLIGSCELRSLSSSEITSWPIQSMPDCAKDLKIINGSGCRHRQECLRHTIMSRDRATMKVFDSEHCVAQTLLSVPEVFRAGVAGDCERIHRRNWESLTASAARL
jgi:hypothetical protein